MKKSLFVVVLLGLLFSCSPEDEQLRQENQSCECFVLTEVYEGEEGGSTLLSASTDTVTDECSKDGLIEETTLESGNIQVITWNCHSL